MKKILSIFLAFMVVLTLMSVSVFAEETTTETTSTDTTTETESDSNVDSTSNFYEVIEGCWIYIFPADVIADNQGLITLFTMITTMFIIFAPAFCLVGIFFRRRR